MHKFNNEDQEREFWATHDVVDYVDMSKQANLDLSKLKPSTKTMNLRIPEGMLANLKILANKRDVPYQSFVKTVLADRIADEFRE